VWCAGPLQVRIVLAYMFASWGAIGLAAAPRPLGPPKVLLHVPFDGTTEAAFSVTGRLKASYLHAAYRPGVKAQGAELGSDRFPSGIVLPCRGLLDKARGSIELWYMPLWDPANPTQQSTTRTLATDEKPSGAAGHFWLVAERGSIIFGLQAQQAASVSAPVRRWRPETWHHIVAAWDADSGIKLFLDGERVAEQEANWVLPQSELLYVGADRSGGFRADGLFDELRLYDRALTPTEAELAFIHNLKADNAPAREEAAEPRRPEPKPPRLTFHASFDNVLEAQTAAGSARPVAAEGARFAKGVLGQALVAGSGLNLAYAFERNVSRDSGALSLWAASLPERRLWRGVLLSDDLFAADPQRVSPGSLALWLDREGENRGIFSLWPLAFSQPLPRWDERDWFHFAASWRRGEQAVFYVNGREVGRAGGPQATWGTGLPKRLHVGSLAGRIAAGALLDDLRFYDAPLPREQVQKQAFQFLLPFVLQLGRTLYERGAAAELLARFYNPLDEKAAFRLTVRVLSPAGTEVARAEAPLEAPPRDWARLRIPLPAEGLAAEGLYEVVTACEGRLSCPRAFFLVVAPEPEPAGAEAAPKLELVETIECAKRLTRDAFCESGGARLVRIGTGADAYVEAGAYPDARFAFRFAVANPGVPHVAVVTYPADRVRSAEIIMTSRRYPSSRDVATGYFVDQADALDQRMVELPIYFWPRERDNALIFRTLSAGQPAACARVVVRQFPGRLPPASAEAPKDGGRTFGVHWDDPAVPLQFGAPGQRPHEVYESFRRLTDYMLFTGQRLLCYPVVWHAGLLYPSESEEFRLGAGAEAHPADWLEYLLHLCERRGIQFLPEIIFDDTVALSNAFGAQTFEEVAAGAPTARMVAWDDTLARGGPGELPKYNPLHPAVRASLLDRVTDIVERYGKSPALLGVSVHLGAGQSTWFGSIQCGYDDATVADFVKEEKFELPEGKSGPTRFSERARWILANKLDQWVAFRCRKLRAVYGDLASRVESKRPGLKLFLTVGLPDSMSWNPLLNLTTLANRQLSLDALCREAGLDPALYRDRPANLILRRATFPNDDRSLAYRFMGMGPNPHPVLARDLAFLSEGAAPFLAFPRTAVASSNRYFESSVGAVRPLPGLWWPEHPLRASHPTPTGRRFLEPLAHAVAELDCLSLTIGGGTLATAGHEEAIRDFARAFRALPHEPFNTVLGMADPLCLRELLIRDGHFLYLVNRTGSPLDAYAAFSGKDVKLRDFVDQKELALAHAENRQLPVALPADFVSEHALPEDEGPAPRDPNATQPVSGALLHVRLEPYQLRSYRVLTTGARIQYAGATVPDAFRVRLAQRIESAKGLVAHSAAGAEVVAAGRATLDLIARAWRKRELARVEYLLDSYPLARLR